MLCVRPDKCFLPMQERKIVIYHKRWYTDTEDRRSGQRDNLKYLFEYIHAGQKEMKTVSENTLNIYP